MIKSSSNEGLAPFYQFFETFGPERLRGLNETHISCLNDNDKEEAWNYLLENFTLSDEKIAGLYILDKDRAVPLFKRAIDEPLEQSAYPSEQQEIERNRLLMLKYINAMEPDKKYVDAISNFASSQFPQIRAECAQSLPICFVTPSTVEALKKIILTETERLPLTCAITKLMVLHGLDFDADDPLYDSIYMLLRSDDQKKKLAGFDRLEQIQVLNYV